MKASFTIPVAIIIGGIIIALAVYISLYGSKNSFGDPSLLLPISASDHILGNPMARVKIVEYADFDCTYCSGFEMALRQIVASGDGEVAWVYRHFPLIEAHPNAYSHARAAECAAAVGGNEGFWKFGEALLLDQPIAPYRYGALALRAGLDGDAFAACYSTASSTIEARIHGDRQNALELGAQGVPFSVILAEGRPPIVINGAYPYDVMKQLVDQALGK